MRGNQQDAALAEQSTARILSQHDAPEAAAVYVWNTVMACEPLIHECVVGREQIEDAAVLSQHALEEELGLAPERLAKVVVEIRELVLIRRGAFQISQVEPLAGKIVDERMRLRIGQHPAYLR